jgi:hypothetical protein
LLPNLPRRASLSAFPDPLGVHPSSEKRYSRFALCGLATRRSSSRLDGFHPHPKRPFTLRPSGHRGENQPEFRALGRLRRSAALFPALQRDRRVWRTAAGPARVSASGQDRARRHPQKHQATLRFYVLETECF